MCLDASRPSISSFMSSIFYSHTDVAKARRCSPMTCVRYLQWSSFPTGGYSPDSIVITITYGIHRGPKQWSNACIGSVFQESTSLASLDFKSKLCTKLKVETLIIDA